MTQKEKTTVPIAPQFGMDYGMPPQLHYKYPPPNPFILNNIMQAIAAVPKLYVQVCHLMNKMNLPPPFVHKAPNVSLESGLIKNRSLED
jgi:U11/U12 small nuclear ribonucleoprotein SNRNP65